MVLFATPFLVVTVCNVITPGCKRRYTNPIGRRRTVRNKPANLRYSSNPDGSLFLLDVGLLPIISDHGDGGLSHSRSSNEMIQRGVVVKGSLKAKIPPSLHISSTNLRISDPIGQGKTEILNCMTLT